MGPRRYRRRKENNNQNITGLNRTRITSGLSGIVEKSVDERVDDAARNQYAKNGYESLLIRYNRLSWSILIMMLANEGGQYRLPRKERLTKVDKSWQRHAI